MDNKNQKLLHKEIPSVNDSMVALSIRLLLYSLLKYHVFIIIFKGLENVKNPFLKGCCVSIDFLMFKRLFLNPFEPLRNASQRCKELYGVVHQHLSHSWHWISFIIRSFLGAKKGPPGCHQHQSHFKCSVGNFRVDQNWDITIFFQRQKWLIASTYNFWCFGAKIQIFEKLAMQPKWGLLE